VQPKDSPQAMGDVRPWRSEIERSHFRGVEEEYPTGIGHRLPFSLQLLSIITYNEK